MLGVRIVPMRTTIDIGKQMANRMAKIMRTTTNFHETTCMAGETRISSEVCTEKTRLCQ